MCIIQYINNQNNTLNYGKSKYNKFSRTEEVLLNQLKKPLISYFIYFLFFGVRLEHLYI